MNIDHEVMAEEYVSTKRARQLLDVTASTLRGWDRKNYIKSIRTTSNTRRYALSSIYSILGFNPVEKKKKYAYCRVSSKKQTEDFDRQKGFLQSKYPQHEIVGDVGSGINWNRPGFKTILEQSMQGNVEEVVVSHRDRLCRFAFELIEWIFQTNGTKLVVLNEETGKSKDKELADDILSIVHVYSCRNMGKRRYCTKKENRENIEDKPEQANQTTRIICNENEEKDIKND